MKRILFIHWDRVEAEERAGRLRGPGREVEIFWSTDGAGAREVRANPPDLFVIDLSRRPSHGRNFAIWLRQQNPTRHVPIIFSGGEQEEAARVRAVIPDAEFTDWSRIRGAVRAAAGRRNDAPVVPPTPGFYSGTPLPKKLGFREGAVAALLGAPAGFERLLGKLPRGARLRRSAGGAADLVLLFTRSGADLDRRFAAAVRSMAAGGSMWIIWPKKASAAAGDLTQPRVRAYGMARGLVDFKVASVDATWTGLRFARRSRDRK